MTATTVRRALVVGMVLLGSTAGLATTTRPAQAVVSPAADLSSSGDYATDQFGDPWDFDNVEDFSPYAGVQAVDADTIGYDKGWLVVTTRQNTFLRLATRMPGVIPWGRDTALHPIDSGRYTRLTFRLCNDGPGQWGGIFWSRPDGVSGAIPIAFPAGCGTYDYDLTNAAQYALPGRNGAWSGVVDDLTIVRSGTADRSVFRFDWVSLHRPDTGPSAANVTLPEGTPQPVVLSPNRSGGADYASLARGGDAWDFEQPSDVAQLVNATGSVQGGQLAAAGAPPALNDPAVVLPLGNVPIDGTRFHRATIDVCYDGASWGLADVPGQGMMGRLAWLVEGSVRLSESQDFVVYPGCQAITLDLATNPPEAVHDESTIDKVGWAGRRIMYVRFDAHEDRSGRGFQLRDFRLAEDANFTSTFDIHFLDRAWTSGTTAEVFVTAQPDGTGGTLVGRTSVAEGGTTFTWNGRDVNGAQLPNGAYWVNVRLRNSSGRVATAVSGGPVVLGPLPESQLAPWAGGGAPAPPAPAPAATSDRGTTPSTPPAKVVTVAKSGKSKLYVDVNPNKGKGYWKIQVQRQQADGSWKALKTYRTKGKEETRTINLKRGTYRVWVKPKYGYQGTISGGVYLKR